ncbi:MAG: cyclic pyranopterin monophosphate synthase MoaC [Deltaproteobacteria bacterium]|nr:MAG: cyclic pyranopterin monophosphate synthase MoaC [Deltaproteobacteria bacterium]
MANDKQAESPKTLTHMDKDGAARMVDVGHKALTKRKALAQAIVSMQPETLKLLMARQLPKGDALQVARVAGIMAAKKTPDLIPLCHPIPLSKAEVEFEAIDEDRIRITADVRNMAQTGVEMEALTACSVAALTLYDMAKAVDPAMCIETVCLLEKEGGKRGHWLRTSEGSE